MVGTAAEASVGGGMRNGQVVGSVGERGAERGGPGQDGDGSDGRQMTERVKRKRAAGHGGSGERGRESISPAAGGRTGGTAVAESLRVSMARTGRVRLWRRGVHGARGGEREGGCSFGRSSSGDD